MNIIKRNGTEMPFDVKKIVKAITKANLQLNETERISNGIIEQIAVEIEKEFLEKNTTPSVELVQDAVELKLLEKSLPLERLYANYRLKRALARKNNTTDEGILELVERNNEEIKQENANKDSVINPTQRDYIAGEVSRDITMRLLLPDDVVDAHKKGLIHFHDSDYFIQHMHNCCLVNLEDMLQNGTVISETMIEPPKSFSTACNIATQIVAQVASNQYGGQSISLAHLAPFVDVSRKKIRKEIQEDLGDILTPERVEAETEKRLMKEIISGVQTIQYQLVTLMTTNGQTPFITLFMYLDEVPEGQTRDDLATIIKEVLRQRTKGIQDETGAWITPAFPKLIYVLDEDNAYEGSEYYDITVMAAKCTAKRMVPDYISAKKMKELKGGNVYTCMGCRSFLTYEPTIKNADGTPKFYGRFNQGVVTLNLVDVACSSDGNMEKFWKILDERLELCHKALRCRHERLLGTPSDVSPILWQYGAFARLKKGELIDKLLYGGYSTISLGYAGLYEMCMRMTGKSHTDDAARPFAMAVMQRLNDKCKEWREAENIAYSVYGTPLESTTYKFAKCLKARFGEIKDVTDHNYITNSYHVCVRETIDAFSKLSFEAPFQELSPGGAISYVEIPNMNDNIEGVITVMQHIYENIMYAELNIKSDLCEECGYDGEIQIIEDENKKLIWKCPKCGNTDERKLHVARRTCGYIGVQFFNQGRTAEIRDRKTHL